jgi:hypothetical protein
MFDWQLESQHREESREIQSDEVEAAKDRAKSRWGWTTWTASRLRAQKGKS